MISKALFRKNFTIFASISLLFIFLALAAAWILTSFERDRMFTRPAQINQVLLANLDDDPFKAVIKLNKIAEQGFKEHHELINAEGRHPHSGVKILPQPLRPEQIAELTKNSFLQLHTPFSGRPPMIISTTLRKDIYLATEMGPPPNDKPIGPVVTLISLVACVLLSIGVALVYQFSKYNLRASEAFAVLSSLRQGNLSVRLPHRKLDELSSLTDAFNQMAGDIETMVSQLHKADSARRQLLQDLAHDLRTPLTSLRSFLETLKESGDKLSTKKKQEVLALCFSEVQYFGKLVEDLLFLAQIKEPKYSSSNEVIDLKQRVEEQISIFKQREPHLTLNLKTDGENFKFLGSPRLIDRLLRNALENSTSFAHSQIQISIKSTDKELRLSLLDDGPGFTPSALSEFGNKKSSRSVNDSHHSNRISVGIGSVIMKEIVQLHSGSLEAENVLDQDICQGAQVIISLRKS